MQRKRWIHQSETIKNWVEETTFWVWITYCSFFDIDTLRCNGVGLWMTWNETVGYFGAYKHFNKYQGALNLTVNSWEQFRCSAPNQWEEAEAFSPSKQLPRPNVSCLLSFPWLINCAFTLGSNHFQGVADQPGANILMSWQHTKVKSEWSCPLFKCAVISSWVRRTNICTLRPLIISTRDTGGILSAPFKTPNVPPL